MNDRVDRVAKISESITCWEQVQDNSLYNMPSDANTPRADYYSGAITLNTTSLRIEMEFIRRAGQSVRCGNL